MKYTIAIILILASNNALACVMKNPWDCGGGALSHSDGFINSDHNDDNKLSRKEFNTELGYNDKIFTCTDKDSDNFISREEFDKYNIDCSNTIRSDESFKQLLDESFEGSNTKRVPMEDWNKQFKYEGGNQ